MSFLELAANRQSVRDYLPGKAVEREKIERCLEAARLAPSTSNSQPWSFIVVDDPELLPAVAASTYSGLLSFNRFAEAAPVLVVVVTEPPVLSRTYVRLAAALKKRPYHLLDVGMAAEHFCLQAAEEGLGTCMLGWFDERAVKRELGIPSRKRVDLIITLGYPASQAVRPKKRKSLNRMRSYNRQASG
jgi:nitroreductase